MSMLPKDDNDIPALGGYDPQSHEVQPIGMTPPISDAAGNQSYGALLVSTGGAKTYPLAAGEAADTTFKTGTGYLGSILVVTPGSNPLLVFDNASGHTGTVIGAVPANAGMGTLWPCGMPAFEGMTVEGNVNNPGVTFNYS